VTNGLWDYLLGRSLVYGHWLDRDNQFIGTELDASGDENVASERFRRRCDRGINRQHGDQTGVAGRCFGKNSRKAVKAFLLVDPFEFTQRRINFDPRTLLAQEQCGNLKARAVRRLERTLLHRRFNLAGDTSEYRNDAGIVPYAHAT
jgi:hypothetical protein